MDKNKDVVPPRVKVHYRSFPHHGCPFAGSRTWMLLPPLLSREPLTRCRSTATSRRGNFRPDDPYWADSGSFERLSRERGGTTTGRLCAAQNSRSFERRVFPSSNANVKRKFITPAKKRVPETFFRFEEPPDPSCGRFARWKIDRPRVSCWKLKRRCSRRLGFCLAFRPGRFSFGCIFQCVFVMPLIPFCQTFICRMTTFGCDGIISYYSLRKKLPTSLNSADYCEWTFVSRVSNTRIHFVFLLTDNDINLTETYGCVHRFFLILRHL